jgi:hypothetical protein
MKVEILSMAAIALAASGCPADNKNPSKLWLALDGSEVKVRLIPQEPQPY